MDKQRIFLVGVGGQGTLTATNLLGRIALDHGLPVVAGEIHGMAQRGGVVESALLLGGYKSPRITHGEADILLGFEPLETLRARCFLKNEGVVVSNSERIPPISVSCGREDYPEAGTIESSFDGLASETHFIPCLSLGEKAGTVMSANMVLLASLLSLDKLPFGLEELKTAVKKYLKPKLVDVNLKAISLGAEAIGRTV